MVARSWPAVTVPGLAPLQLARVVAGAGQGPATDGGRMRQRLFRACTLLGGFAAISGVALSGGFAQGGGHAAGAERRGGALFTANCAGCHGTDLADGRGPSLFGPALLSARALAGRPDIAFVICGEGPNRANLQEQAAGLHNVQFHDLQPAERMAEFLSLASVHLLPQKAEAADLVLPSKLTNMLASGRPVVATAAAGTGLHAEVEGCGINSTPGDGAAMADAITRLIDDPARRHALGEAARLRAVDRWSRPAIIAAAEQRMLALVEQHAR